MYSTCLFCNRGLGLNEVIEAFPVGRRLAFDPQKGRLWVVCPSCNRWNLTPIEERWEAIEECERVFRGLRTRVHSEEIGAAKHPEGLRLVRIGKPIPVEFALWRYGETAARRLQKQVVFGAAAAAGGLTLVASGVLSGFAAGYALMQAPNIVNLYQTARSRVWIPVPDRGPIRVFPWKVDLLSPGPGEPLGVRVKHGGEEIRLSGQDARRTASKVLPVFNRHGARRKVVREAVEEVQETGGTEGYIEETWGKGKPRPGSGIGWVRSNDMRGGAIGHLPVHTRLALEMSLQEEQERRAMEGELAILEAAWKEAEALATISDDLLLPEDVEEKLEELRSDQG